MTASDPIPFTQVHIDDPFWNPRLLANRETSLVEQYKQLKSSGRIDALRLQWKPGSDLPQPHIFWDSDTAKWLEAACYTYQLHPGASLREKIDEVAGLFAAAQRPDGYINSHISVVCPEKRWQGLYWNHELYSAGHIFEAAIAHRDATGETFLLETATRFADLIDRTFGREPGQIRGYCGHEEIELALVRLYRATGNERYLRLASYFVEERGQQPAIFEDEAKADGRPLTFGLAYYQAHLPVREQKEAVGHAVRAAYLYCAMADLAREMQDPSMLEACRRLWDNVTSAKMYITGQIGSTHHGETFTDDYDLPPETAYCETCAGVGLILWGARMLRLEDDARYADVVERALYNGVLSGVSLDGRSFFYENRLADRHGKHRRQEWFPCACCPSNLSRLLASLGGLVASVTPRGLTVHLYLGNDLHVTLPMAGEVRLRTQTNYPWEGSVRLSLELERSADFELALRIPGWCRGFALKVNGQPVPVVERRGYAILQRLWNSGDVVEVEMPMPIERVTANPAVLMCRGQVALQRGPVVYCLEEVDHPEGTFQVSLPRDTPLKAEFHGELLGGTMVLTGETLNRTPQNGDGRLYLPAEETRCAPGRLFAIPYHAWANRAPGAMTVWIAESA